MFFEPIQFNTHLVNTNSSYDDEKLPLRCCLLREMRQTITWEMWCVERKHFIGALRDGCDLTGRRRCIAVCRTACGLDAQDVAWFGAMVRVSARKL